MRRDGDYDEYRPDTNGEYPVAILSMDLDEGREYAEIVGIKNYRIFLTKATLQGARLRSVVVTPNYIHERLIQPSVDSYRIISMARDSVSVQYRWN